MDLMMCIDELEIQTRALNEQLDDAQRKLNQSQQESQELQKQLDELVQLQKNYQILLNEQKKSETVLKIKIGAISFGIGAGTIGLLWLINNVY